MSESMAFIGGVAIAGLAAMVMLKGNGNNPIQGMPGLPQMQTPIVQPMQQPMQQFPGSFPVAGQTCDANEFQRLKSENERLTQDNNNKNLQISQFQQYAYDVNRQQQLNNFNAQNQGNLQSSTPQANANGPWWTSPIVWAVGGMTLTIGGGVVVAGVLALFSGKDRNGRTVQVIHPYHGATAPLAPIRRAEYLPPRSEGRRVETHDYDDM
jgi:hypothetical protein